MSLFKRKSTKKEKKSEAKDFDELSQMVDKKEKEQVKKPENLEVKKDKKDKKKDKSEEIKKDHGKAYKHLIQPVITEKVSFLGMYNQYIFEVDPRANKIEIKKAVEKLYGVKPIKINIINMRGKNVRYGRQFGRLKNWKKAIVTLRSGDKIDVYEGV